MVAELADADNYKAIYKPLKPQQYASPFVEKYVCEALFLMGESEYGSERLKKRFQPMAYNKMHSTLFEGGVMVEMDTAEVLQTMYGVVVVLLFLYNMFVDCIL
ncbi:hypothetical protein PI23P_02282 [Polaribacter irgensii 23-P]|uniref:Uncharacterized protein n=1 Tax=Polaribacter irgensii 23-P TaxID=313594 RepID=A4BWE3_9FLAO|nr:hypothetical protein [Polaribacter irgensii]EAR13284.1 hypothetical protein PI23P_02282 [Polaribacter irgensii 23-P]